MDQKFVVAIGPAMGGKSTFCRSLDGYDKFSFAEPLYEMIGSVIGTILVEQLRRQNRKHEPIPALCGHSLRHALQTLGTEWGRNVIGKDVWVNNLLRRSEFSDRIAIDDLRFPNEYEAMLDRGAVFVRLIPELTADDDWRQHSSEQYWQGFAAHAEIRWRNYDDLIAKSAEFDPDPFFGTAPGIAYSRE